MKRRDYATSAGVATAVLACLLMPADVFAEIKVGVTGPVTGPLATFSVGVSSVIAAWPKTIGGEAVVVTLMDDGGDPGKATGNARRLISEFNVDVLVGFSLPSLSTPVSTVASESEVAYLTLTPTQGLMSRSSPDDQVVPEKSGPLPTVVFEHMKAKKVANVGFIGFSDSWGDLWMKELKGLGARLGLQPVAEERYGRADGPVDAQAGRLAAATPDAVLVAASGTASLLPHVALRKLGYTGAIYHTHDSATTDFIRAAGAYAANTIMPATPDMVADFKAKQGFGRMSRVQTQPAGELLSRLVPVALEAGRPGTREFRAALRKAIEQETAPARTAAAENANRPEERVWVLVTVKEGSWALAK